MQTFFFPYKMPCYINFGEQFSSAFSSTLPSKTNSRVLFFLPKIKVHYDADPHKGTEFCEGEY